MLCLKDDNLSQTVCYFKLGELTMEKITYVKPAVEKFIGWDSEFAAGSSESISDQCDFGTIIF